jgi:hypothetical protein
MMNSDVRTSDCSRLTFAPVGYHRYAVGQSQSANSRHFILVGWIIRSFVQIITGSEAVSERSTFCSLNSLRFLIIGVQCSRANSTSGSESQPANQLVGDKTGVGFGVCRNTDINKRGADISSFCWGDASSCFRVTMALLGSNHENDRLLTSCPLHPPRRSLRPCTGWSPQVRNGTVRASH